MLFKLFNNAVYGKTMENERKRVDVKLVTKWNDRYGAEALISKPNFHSSDIFHENLVAVQLLRTEICIRKKDLHWIISSGLVENASLQVPL